MTSKTIMLKDVPFEDRPRERMLKHGSQVLSNAELLAILLRTGTKNESAVLLANRLLHEMGGLRHLMTMKTEQFVSINGIGPAKAMQIQAAIELGKRVSISRLGEDVIIHSPQDAADYLTEDLRYLPNEHFVCLFLNTKNKVIGRQTLSVGTLNASIVHPRDVFRAAIQKNSASILCAHNHPSGNPEPSPEDLEVTRRLKEAGQLVGIELLDHVIIGDDGFISLKESGYV